MAELIILLIVGGLAFVALAGLFQLVLGWIDNRNVDRLTEEWLRRSRERRQGTAHDDTKEKSCPSA